MRNVFNARRIKINQALLNTVYTFPFFFPALSPTRGQGTKQHFPFSLKNWERSSKVLLLSREMIALPWIPASVPVSEIGGLKVV